MLRRAHDGEPDATDDAALVEAVGGTVVVGRRASPTNLKITDAATTSAWLACTSLRLAAPEPWTAGRR